MIEVLNEQNIISRIYHYLNSQQEGCIIGIPTTTSVFIGSNTNYNKMYCQQHNINLFSFPHKGGVIVCFPGDFEIGYFTKDPNKHFNEDFIIFFINWLKSRGINAVSNHNDIIIDDKNKVLGCGLARYGNIFYHAIHISIYTDPAIVQEICLKETTKIPGFLSRYNITTDEIQKLFIDFVNNYHK